MTSEILVRFGISKEAQEVLNEEYKTHMWKEGVLEKIEEIHDRVERMLFLEDCGAFDHDPEMFQDEKVELMTAFAELHELCK